MDRSPKELAFLRGIYVEPEWTARFTEVFNENVDLDGLETITYLMAGTGDHSIELDEKLGEAVSVFPVCEDEELREIAQAKANTAKSAVDFSTSPPMSQSDLAVLDSSFLAADELYATLPDSLSCAEKGLVFFYPTAGSFGEIFSILWEVLESLETPGLGPEVESLISGLPTVEDLEQRTLSLGLKRVESFTKNGIFEFENGRDLVESPLAGDFLLPAWLQGLREDDKGRALDLLAQKIDEDGGGMSFRFTVKATVISGKRY